MSKRQVSVILAVIVACGALAILAIAQGLDGPTRQDLGPDDNSSRSKRGASPVGFEMGEVISVDAATNSLVIKSLRGRENRTVKVAAEAIVTRKVNSAATDLKVGEMISVRGTPTELIAQSIESADAPEMLGPGSSFGGSRDRVFTRADGSVTGKIIETNPLTVEVDASTKVVVKLDGKQPLQVSRTVKIPLSDLKVGEFISARGNNDEQDNLTATTISVTPERKAPGGPPRGGLGEGATQ